MGDIQDNPTSRDIAEIAGVSQATVSRALRNSPLVRQETRERIQQIARELNYSVNRNAAALRQGQRKSIALLIFSEPGSGEDSINPFFLAMLGDIVRFAARVGCDVLVSLQQVSDDWHIQYRSSRRADGLILLGYGDYLTYRDKLEALVASTTHFITWGPVAADKPGASVSCDNEAGGYEATRHLLRLGRRRIAYIGGTSAQQNPEYAARYAGYRRALSEAGLDAGAAPRIAADNGETPGYEAMVDLLGDGRSFDALVAATDLLAIGAMRALSQHGVAVPTDVSVVGFDDLPLARYVTPMLTTVRQDTREAAEALVSGLMRRMRNDSIDPVLMSPRLVVRDSCGGKQASTGTERPAPSIG